MRAFARAVLLSMAAVGLATASRTSAAPSAACLQAHVSACPDTDGHVVIDARYAPQHPDVIDGDAMQCAIDCLNGDTASEATPAPDAQGHVDMSALIKKARGGVLELVPGLDYDLTQGVATHGTLHLPLVARTPVIIRGNGATLLAITGVTAIEHLLPRTSAKPAAADYEWVALKATGWSLTDLNVRGLASPEPEAMSVPVLHLEAMRAFRLTDCQFQGRTDVGIRIVHCPDFLAQGEGDNASLVADGAGDVTGPGSSPASVTPSLFVGADGRPLPPLVVCPGGGDDGLYLRQYVAVGRLDDHSQDPAWTGPPRVTHPAVQAPLVDGLVVEHADWSSANRGRAPLLSQDPAAVPGDLGRPLSTASRFCRLEGPDFPRPLFELHEPGGLLVQGPLLIDYTVNDWFDLWSLSAAHASASLIDAAGIPERMGFDHRGASALGGGSSHADTQSAFFGFVPYAPTRPFPAHFCRPRNPDAAGSGADLHCDVPRNRREDTWTYSKLPVTADEARAGTLNFDTRRLAVQFVDSRDRSNTLLTCP